jgi:hypothetical protein
MKPYLVRLHMTIDCWRPNQDAEAWRLSNFVLDSVMVQEKHRSWILVTLDVEAHVLVKAVPHFAADIEALKKLCQAKSPPLRAVRCWESGTFLYGFGDASGAAFGASVQVADTIKYQYRQWIAIVMEEDTFNWRELANLVAFVRELVESGKYNGFKLFVFTDNSTAENAFWKGTSTLQQLYELVLEFRCLEHKHGLLLHVIHISGRRMIAQGTDGLSRADHTQGVIKGLGMVEYLPLHLDPLAREPKLKGWLEKLRQGLEAIFLDPEDWFNKGHGRGNFIWTAPPAAVDVVVEQLGRT